MTAYGAITAFLADLGAVRIDSGEASSSEWRLGDTVIVVSTRPGGAVRVARVLIDSPSVDRVMDALGDLHSGRSGPPPGARKRS